MSYAIAGDAIVARPNFTTPVTNQFAFKLSGADVMHWQPKSRLQQLWERLVEVITQDGNP
jgi:D-hexose-6-phosphate mutarotase